MVLCTAKLCTCFYPLQEEILIDTTADCSLYEHEDEQEISSARSNDQHHGKKATLEKSAVPKKKTCTTAVKLPSDETLLNAISEAVETASVTAITITAKTTTNPLVSHSAEKDTVPKTLCVVHTIDYYANTAAPPALISVTRPTLSTAAAAAPSLVLEIITRLAPSASI